MKIKRYQAITAILFVYGLFMTLYFGLDLLQSGETARFWITLISEVIVITLCYFALKKRDLYREQRKREQEGL